MSHQFRFFPKKWKLRRILDILIALFTAINVILFVFSTKEIDFTLLAFSHFQAFSGRTPRNVPKIAFKQELINYSLDEDIIFLNLPTWSKSYVKCNHKSSEVSCNQIQHAASVLRQWVKNIESMKEKSLKDCKYILGRHYFDGLGNRISIDIYLFLLAVMSNRCLVIEGHYPLKGATSFTGNAFEYQNLVMLNNDTIQGILNQSRLNPPVFLQVFDAWWDNNYNLYFNMPNYMDLDRLIYSTMIYTHNELFDFCFKHFGIHAVYFLSNFLVRIPEANMKSATDAFEKFPKSLYVLGIHLRFHIAGEYFTYGVESTMNSIVPFLNDISRKKNAMFAFSSDSKELETKFLTVYKDITITTDSIKITDFDHSSALTDIAFVMMTDACLLTYRSTFSFTIASRMGKRAWFVEKESPGVFQAGNSQATAVSMIYHQFDFNDWQTSRRFRLKPQHEKAIRYYFKYFVL